VLHKHLERPTITKEIAMTKTLTDSYRDAQVAVAHLKAAVHFVLATAPDGLTNAQVGRTLGIYGGHVGHEGHVSRTLLALLESEGVAEQDPDTKSWRLKKHSTAESTDKGTV
jgi:hypothetical protein